MVDIKICNADVVDGTGKPSYKADVAIDGEKICAIGDLTGVDAKTVIDADGRTLAPGFIDLHTHSDLSFLYDTRASTRIYNGVTTDVFGNCGVGVAPVNERYADTLVGYLKTRIVGNIPAEIELNWRTYEEYLAYINAAHTAVNVVPILGHGAVHIFQKGLAQEEPTAQDIDAMKRLVKEAMSAGAVGMSSGLIYLPGAYTSSNEFIELCKAMKDFGGVYFTHKRNESDFRYEAIDEAAQVARSAGVPLHISHLKITGKNNFGTVKELFAYIKKLQATGLKITYDAYPYNRGATSLLALLPPWASEGGIDKLMLRVQNRSDREKMQHDIEHGLPGWSGMGRTLENWNKAVISSSKSEKNLWMEGMGLQDIADKLNKTVYNTIFDLILEENARTLILVEMMDEKDVEEILSDPDTMVGSDSMTCAEDGLLSKGKPHPRFFGTQAKILAQFCREKKLFSLELAVKKMTSMPARLLGLKDRGEIKDGAFADLVLFDLKNIEDTATYDNPKQYSKGMDYVFVNGRIALKDGRQTDIHAGRVLRRNK